MPSCNCLGCLCCAKKKKKERMTQTERVLTGTDAKDIKRVGDTDTISRDGRKEIAIDNKQASETSSGKSMKTASKKGKEGFLLSEENCKSIPEILDSITVGENEVERISDLVKQILNEMESKPRVISPFIVKKIAELKVCIDDLHEKIPGNIALLDNLPEKSKSVCKSKWQTISKRLEDMSALCDMMKSTVGKKRTPF